MSREAREVVADWLLLVAAAALLASLFLPWSHQFSRAFLVHWAPTGMLRGVPRDPTAWQLYSVADVAFVALVAGLLGVALTGGRVRRAVVLAAAAIALVFVVHAAGVPPTNGAGPLAGPVTNYPQSGAGETVAIAALVVAIAALALSFGSE